MKSLILCVVLLSACVESVEDGPDAGEVEFIQELYTDPAAVVDESDPREPARPPGDCTPVPGACVACTDGSHVCTPAEQR